MNQANKNTDVYSEEFVNALNEESDKVVWRSDYINEIFMHFFLKIEENIASIKFNGLNNIEEKPFTVAWSNNIAAIKKSGMCLHSKIGIAYNVVNIMLYLCSLIAVIFLMFMLPVIILIKRENKGKSDSTAFSIIRSPASYNKMKFLQDEGLVDFYFDDVIKNQTSKSSMYSYGTRIQSLNTLYMVPLVSIRDFFLVAMDSIALIGWQHSGYVMLYFSNRIVHKASFEYFFDLLLRGNRQSIYYTGNKEDRFAVLEMRLCKKYNMRSICIPHGIEYSFKVPAGLVGDVFYCTTSHAQKHLSQLYGVSDKFVYSKEIAFKMFSRGLSETDRSKIVFFPESREPEKNLRILEVLINSGFLVYVKLHIKDNPDNYIKYSDKFIYIDDFDNAISNSICLARKSTVLVEAVYNNSLSIAVLTDSKDRGYVEYMLPSLTDNKIIRIYTFDKLVSMLNDVVKNNVSNRPMQDE